MTLTLTQKIIYLLKALGNETRRKIYWALLQGKILEECYRKTKKVYKETLEETEITRWWVLFLRKLHKLIHNYSQLAFCTVPLHFFTVT